MIPAIGLTLLVVKAGAIIIVILIVITPTQGAVRKTAQTSDFPIKGFTRVTNPKQKTSCQNEYDKNDHHGPSQFLYPKPEMLVAPSL